MDTDTEKPRLSFGRNRPIHRDLAFGQQLAFFQVAGFGGEVGGVRVVRDHHNGFAEFLIQAREQGEDVLRGGGVQVAGWFVG